MKAKELIQSYDNKEECVGTAQWCKEVAEELFSLQEENDYLSKRVDNLVVLHSNVTNQLITLVSLVKGLHNAKGRYHTQLAACNLFELLDLPCVLPAKENKKVKVEIHKTS